MTGSHQSERPSAPACALCRLYPPTALDRLRDRTLWFERTAAQFHMERPQAFPPRCPYGTSETHSGWVAWEPTRVASQAFAAVGRISKSTTAEMSTQSKAM